MAAVCMKFHYLPRNLGVWEMHNLTLLKPMPTITMPMPMLRETFFFDPYVTPGCSRGGWVGQRCRVSYITGASNWYWLTVGKGLLSLQQIKVEGRISSVSSLSFIFLSPLFFSFISSIISLLPFPGRRHKMTHKGWHVIKPQLNQLFQEKSYVLHIS